MEEEEFCVAEPYSGKQSKKGKNKEKEIVKVERTPEEWASIYPSYPSSGDGFLHAFSPDQHEGYLSALDKYGFCVVKVLNEEQCDATIPEFLKDSNENPKGKQIKPVTIDDPSSWERENFPSVGKFMFSKNSFGQRAFDNRTNENIYKVFTNIYKDAKLWCSIDKWGLMRGTKNMKFKNEDGEEVVQDRPDWHYELKMHWDLNPWLYEAEMSKHHAMYQGLVALVDCPEEVGGFICVPGSTAFLNQWTKEHKPNHLKPLSIQVPPNDIMLDYKQRVPLRKGEMVIWNSGQAHANFANTCNRLRIYQFIRMMPACPKCKARDRFCAPRVLEEDPTMNAKVVCNIQFSPLGRKLVGLEEW